MRRTAGWRKWRWVWRRLSRMSAAELLHRVFEQCQRWIDRFDTRPWSAFGHFKGTVCGLLIFQIDAADPDFRTVLAEEASPAKCGRFVLLGRRWPIPIAGATWWKSDLWLTDPVSGALWPGAARSAFDVDYRGHAALGEVKFVWELNRLQFLPLLTLQAKLGGADGALLFDILRGWMHANPPGRGVNWTSGIEAASRVVSLLAALSFVKPATAADEMTVKAFLDAHVRWIARYPSRFSSANNHRVAELTALFLAAISAPGLTSAGKARRAQAALEREMLRQFHADGGGAEQTTAYAAYALEWFALAGAVGDAVGRPFSQASKARAALAVDHLRWLTDDSGRAVAIGDDDHSRVLALTQEPEPRYAASVAAMAARWLKAPQPRSNHRDLTLRDLIGGATPTAAPPVGMRIFPEGGMTVWRRPRTDGLLLLTFDHGPLGHGAIAAHGHADALAVRLHWGEEAVLVSPGTYLYHAGGDVRGTLRGTPAHNTLALAGADQSRIIGPFAWSRRATTKVIEESADAVQAEHDGYLRRFGLIHRRRVRCEQDTIFIEDGLIGAATARLLPWSLGFTLAPEVQAEVDGVSAFLNTSTGRRLALTSEAVNGEAIEWRLVSTPYAPSFGVLTTTHRLELSGWSGAEPRVARIRIAVLANHQARPT